MTDTPRGSRVFVLSRVPLDPLLYPCETLDYDSRVKNKTTSCLCTTEQPRHRKPGHAGTFHPLKSYLEPEGNRGLTGVSVSRIKGGVLEPSSISVRLQGVRGKDRGGLSFPLVQLAKKHLLKQPWLVWLSG